MPEYKLKILRLRPAGMFSNVNEVVQQIYLAKVKGYQFEIDWGKSCYADPVRPDNPWEYYFEQPWDTQYTRKDDLVELPAGKPVACAKNNIITPREINGQCDPLLLPNDRFIPHGIIIKHITIKPLIANIIDDYRSRFLHHPRIGLHIRGAGRTDGGVPKLRAGLPKERGVPLSTYFLHVDKALGLYSKAVIFLASDSEFVVSKCKQRYGPRVRIFPSQRSDYGEMHVPNHPENTGLKFDRPRLGLEAIVEAYLLASSDIFVHGNSNLVNFVLCLNPMLRHVYVYSSA